MNTPGSGRLILMVSLTRFTTVYVCIFICVLIGHGTRTGVRAREKTFKRREIEGNGIHMTRQPKGLTGEEGTSWRRGAKEGR